MTIVQLYANFRQRRIGDRREDLRNLTVGRIPAVPGRIDLVQTRLSSVFLRDMEQP